MAAPGKTSSKTSKRPSGSVRRPVAPSRASVKGGQRAASTSDAAHGTGQPRYLQLAHELRRAIADGRYPVGSRLPTEVELCSQFGISRFTARAAIRVLSSAGLVTSRQRVGTVVVATPDHARYTHDVGSVRDLLQYAQDTELQLVYVGRVALNKSRARDFGAKAGQEWIYAFGVRRSGGDGSDPICVTRLFLNPSLKGIEARLRARKSAVYALIEAEYGLTIERVEQELHGVALDADDAANLGCAAGAPALRIVRRYFADDGRLLEVAESIHPSDRFSYRMVLRK